MLKMGRLGDPFCTPWLPSGSRGDSLLELFSAQNGVQKKPWFGSPREGSWDRSRTPWGGLGITLGRPGPCFGTTVRTAVLAHLPSQGSWQSEASWSGLGSQLGPFHTALDPKTDPKTNPGNTPKSDAFWCEARCSEGGFRPSPGNLRQPRRLLRGGPRLAFVIRL